MKKLALSLCGLALILLVPTSMFADTIFNFSFNSVVVHGQPGLPYAGSVQFDAVATNTPGTLAIVGVTGTVNGNPIGTDTISGFSGENGNQGTLSSANRSLSLVNGVDLLFSNGNIELDAGNLAQIYLNTGYLAYLNFYANPSLYASEVASINLASLKHLVLSQLLRSQGPLCFWARV